jgi:serine/threonine-protein kinase RsbW
MNDLIVIQLQHWIQVDFVSSLRYVDRAVHTLTTFAQPFPLPCQLFDLELVLREGLTNAAQHGNQLDPARRVQCEMDLRLDPLRITIADEGEGFPRPPVRLVDPASPHGRGLLLMELYGFQVTYNAAGNVLVLTKSFFSVA